MIGALTCGEMVQMNNIEIPNIEHSTYIDVSPDRVYQALTTGSGWDQWFTSSAFVDPKPGGEIRFRWKDFGASRATFEDGGPVLEAEPNRRFSFQWSPAGHPTTVTFDLEILGKGTLVKLVEHGYRANKEDLVALIECSVGWGEALTLLKFYLEHGITYGTVPSDNFMI